MNWRIAPAAGSGVPLPPREDFVFYPGSAVTITREIAGVPIGQGVTAVRWLWRANVESEVAVLQRTLSTVQSPDGYITDDGALTGRAIVEINLTGADTLLLADDPGVHIAEATIEDGLGWYAAVYGRVSATIAPEGNAASEGEGVVPLLVFDGDSISTNDYTSNPWHWQARVELLATFPDLAFEEFGVSGQTYTNMYADAATQIDPLVDPVKYTHNILIGLAGANEIVNQTPSAAHEVLVLYGQARQAAGFAFVVCTMLPRTAPIPGSKTFEEYETDRLAFNALIRANWATYADALCDLAADAPLDSPENIGGGAALPTAAPGPYLADGVHPNNAGAALMAARLVPVIREMLV